MEAPRRPGTPREEAKGAGPVSWNDLIGAARGCVARNEMGRNGGQGHFVASVCGASSTDDLLRARTAIVLDPSPRTNAGHLRHMLGLLGPMELTGWPEVPSAPQARPEIRPSSSSLRRCAATDLAASGYKDRSTSR